MFGSQRKHYGGKQKLSDLPRFVHQRGLKPKSTSRGGSRKKTKKDQGKSGSVRLVGWDDTLGRPIYEVVKETVAEQETRSSEEQCRDGEPASNKGDGEARTPTKSLRQTDDQNDVPARKRPDQKASRSYGGRKRGRSALSDTAAAVLGDCKHRVTVSFRKKQRFRPPVSPSETMNTHSTSATSLDILASPEPRKHGKPDDVLNMTPVPCLKGGSICSILDSATKHETSKSGLGRKKAQIKMKPIGDKKLRQNHRVDQFVSPTSSKNSATLARQVYREIKAFDQTEDEIADEKPKSKGRLGHSRRRRNKSRKTTNRPAHRQVTATEEEKKVLENDGGGGRQISSATSPSSARAFFDRLDVTQSLTLDASGRPSPRRGCVRTSRFTNVRCPKLRGEYEAYRAATAGAPGGAEPLAIQEFAEQRGSYFQKSGLFDGLLDEAQRQHTLPVRKLNDSDIFGEKDTRTRDN